MIRWLSLVAVLVAVAVRFWPHAPAESPAGGGAPAPETVATGPVTPAAGVADAGRAGAYGAGVGFRTPERLREHFAKHGAEFGAASAAEYLRMAQSLRDRRPGGDVLEIRRADGVFTRFDRATGAFLAFESDGTIRTFFHPNDGERYFERQAARGSP